MSTTQKHMIPPDIGATIAMMEAVCDSPSAFSHGALVGCIFRARDAVTELLEETAGLRERLAEAHAWGRP